MHNEATDCESLEQVIMQVGYHQLPGSLASLHQETRSLFHNVQNLFTT